MGENLLQSPPSVSHKQDLDLGGRAEHQAKEDYLGALRSHVEFAL